MKEFISSSILKKDEYQLTEVNDNLTNLNKLTIEFDVNVDNDVTKMMEIIIVRRWVTHNLMIILYLIANNRINICLLSFLKIRIDLIMLEINSAF